MSGALFRSGRATWLELEHASIADVFRNDEWYTFDEAEELRVANDPGREWARVEAEPANRPNDWIPQQPELS